MAGGRANAEKQREVAAREKSSFPRGISLSLSDTKVVITSVSETHGATMGLDHEQAVTGSLDICSAQSPPCVQCLSSEPCSSMRDPIGKFQTVKLI